MLRLHVLQFCRGDEILVNKDGGYLAKQTMGHGKIISLHGEGAIAVRI